MSETLEQGGLRVVKLGGSLLDWPKFPERLREWLTHQSPACNVLIAGGGPFADVVRAADHQHALGELISHKLCIELLTVTAHLVGHLLPEAAGPYVPQRIEPSFEARLVLLDVTKLIELDTERSVRPLPASWDVTTDSIAARASILLQASELVLLKSALAPKGMHLRELAAGGFVDTHFPVCAKSIEKIRFVNLRDEQFSERMLVKGHPSR